MANFCSRGAVETSDAICEIPTFDDGFIRMMVRVHFPKSDSMADKFVRVTSFPESSIRRRRLRSRLSVTKNLRNSMFLVEEGKYRDSTALAGVYFVRKVLSGDRVC